MSRSQSKNIQEQSNHKYEQMGHRMRSHTIMSQEDVAAGKKSFWPELEISGLIRNLSPQLFQLSHLTTLYLNDNDLTSIPPEISKLTCLVHLDLSSNKLRSLPSELGDLVLLKELLLANNYLRLLPYELGRLFRIQKLGLKGNPLSSEIMQIYSEPNGTSKLLTWLLENLAFTAEHPPQRPWIPLMIPDRTRPSSIFTVMSYNVLCDKYATRQLYGYCPNWALDWQYRRKNILDEIRHYSADIISLQEVETDQFYNFFMPELKQDGYDGIFSPKSRAKTMIESERKYVDGCAIFFRTSKFSLVKEHLFEFNQLAIANAEGSDDMLNRVMTKDNIGLAALLETKEAAWTNGMPDPMQVCQPLLVCTAHIHWDPEFCDVKLIQTMMLMKELRSIIDEEVQHNFRPGATKNNNPNMPIVLCGDLNALPNSGVCELVMQGRISADHDDFKGIGYKDCLQKLGYNDTRNEYTHSLNLCSVFNNEVMPYTNYTVDFKGIIDYIFYQKQFMTPVGVLGPLSPEWMKENKVIGCPHPHIPSDHFPLLCELELTPSPSSSTSHHSNGMILRR